MLAVHLVIITTAILCINMQLKLKQQGFVGELGWIEAGQQQGQ